jgi:hypothetical protein
VLGIQLALNEELKVSERGKYFMLVALEDALRQIIVDVQLALGIKVLFVVIALTHRRVLPIHHLLVATSFRLRGVFVRVLALLQELSQ